MSDLSDLYQEMILDHYRSPRNRRKMENADRTIEGFNPLCGDRVTVYLSLEDGKVKDVSFEGSGCAISTASASLMTQAVKGKTIEEAEGLFERFHYLLTHDGEDSGKGPELGKLAVFTGVCRFPARVKCATLAWHTVKQGLEGKEEPVSTE